ncbi:NnrS family protein [Dongia rigui]|uniref:NnrS family protein n=1 Tax=Dongia rigui TaxID=940149 RepID=A0ABU5E0T0_9PROT|nr:NnrS family protein [Dongia rigui]MDY0873201.1 NnrS family protein [Dongia rigui]
MSETRFIAVEPEHRQASRFALFDYGFRPFFLIGACQAAVAVPIWVAIWRGSLGWQPTLPPALWHGHEMLFGFATAALAGFMLTAVPNWTGGAAIRGWKLMLLVALWLAGRIAAFTPWPDFFALVDIAFLPALALTLGPGILLRNGRRNGILVAILLLLAFLNAGVHFDGWGWTGLSGAFLSGSWSLRVAIAVFALLIGLIGGRIVPAFTQGGMKMSGVPFQITGHRLVDGAAVLSLAFHLLATGLDLASTIIGVAALIAALANALRLLRWQGWRTLGVPLVWVLHLGYAWLVVGLLLSGLAVFDLVPAASGIHALTAGSFSTMIMAVMSRASLGHTGRQLIASRATAVAYLALTAAALLRVLAPFAGNGEPALIDCAGLFWSLAFLIFIQQYLPILIGARPDGRPG